MAHLCHEELANKGQLPPGNSFLCFSLKCRIHRLLIKTVVLCRVNRDGCIRFQIFDA
jgi:hypothetical protein